MLILFFITRLFVHLYGVPMCCRWPVKYTLRDTTADDIIEDMTRVMTAPLNNEEYFLLDFDILTSIPIYLLD